MPLTSVLLASCCHSQLPSAEVSDPKTNMTQMYSCNRNTLKASANISVLVRILKGKEGQGCTKWSMFERYGNAIVYQ